MVFFDNALVQHDVIRRAGAPPFDDYTIAWFQLRVSRGMQAIQEAIESHPCGHTAEQTDDEVARAVLIQAFHDAGHGNGLVKE